MSQDDPYLFSSLSDVPGLTPIDSSLATSRAAAAASESANGYDGAGAGSRLPNASSGSSFVGEIENARMFIPLLKAITIKRVAVMAITDRGLKISCEESSRAVQASAFFDINLFKRYHLPDNRPLCFAFRMSDLLTALNILFPEQHAKTDDRLYDNSAVKLALKYPVVMNQEGGGGSGSEQLKLQVLGDHNEAAACVNTYDPERLVVFNMAFVNKIILDAEPLIDFWKCADSTSLAITLGISNDVDVAFEMSTKSDRGVFLNRIRSESSYVDHYECTVPMRNQYHMDHMKTTLRPLILASKVSVRTDPQGLLSMQFLIRLDAGSKVAKAQGGGGTDAVNTSAANTGGRGRGSGAGLMISQESSFSDADLNDEVPKCFIEFYILPQVESS